MKEFSAKHPIIFGIALFFAAMVAVVVVMLPLQLVGLSTEAATALARIAVGILLMVVFHGCFSWGKSFSGFKLAIPVLGFVAWNLLYNAFGGGQPILPSAILGAVLLGIAPAVFEEVIFRGITIDAFKRNGTSRLVTLILSALLFSAVHLTNAVGMGLLDVVVQVCYSFAIGLVFGAIYLASEDIVTVICAHAAIDISSQLFATHPTTTEVPVLVVFFVLLAVESVYALWLVAKK